MRLLTSEGSKSMAVLRGVILGLIVVVVLFGVLIIVSLLLR